MLGEKTSAQPQTKLVEAPLEVSSALDPNPISVELPRFHEPLSSIQNYCQSRTFIANSGVNPLVAASSALFSLITKFNYTETIASIDNLQKELVHEVKAFECNAQTHGYLPDKILIARYAICATLDETINNTGWGQATNWQQQSLLSLFHGDNPNPDSFFIILERMLQDSVQHIELLEFFYICLSLGFQGQYRNNSADKPQLDTLTDNLFHIIRITRGDYPSALSAPYKLFNKPAKRTAKPISLWTIAIITASFLISLYAGFNYMVKMTTSPLQSKLQDITHSINYENIA